MEAERNWSGTERWEIEVKCILASAVIFLHNQFDLVI